MYFKKSHCRDCFSIWRAIGEDVPGNGRRRVLSGPAPRECPAASTGHRRLVGLFRGVSAANGRNSAQPEKEVWRSNDEKTRSGAIQKWRQPGGRDKGWEKADALISVGGAWGLKYGTILVGWLTSRGEGFGLLISDADVIFRRPLMIIVSKRCTSPPWLSTERPSLLWGLKNPHIAAWKAQLVGCKILKQRCRLWGRQSRWNSSLMSDDVIYGAFQQVRQQNMRRTSVGEWAENNVETEAWSSFALFFGLLVELSTKKGENC